MRRTPHFSLVVVCLHLSFGLASGDEAKAPPPLPDYPKEDLDVYKRSLWVGDKEVRSATIRALKNYPEGLEIITQYILKQAKTEPKELGEAISSLRPFTKHADFEKRLLDLRRQLTGMEKYERAKVEKTKGTVLVFSEKGVKSEERESRVPLDAKQQLGLELTQRLFEHQPKKYAAEMLEVLQDRLAGREIGLHDPIGEEIVALLPYVKKDRMHDLVPQLTPSLNAFFPDGRRSAYLALVIVTGEVFPFEADADEASRVKIAQKYEQWYAERQQAKKKAN